MPSVEIVYAGDAGDPTAWSGSPAGLGRGFAALGWSVTHVSAEPGATHGALRRLTRHRRVRYSRPLVGLRSAWAARGVSREADLVVQLGSHYVLPADVPFVTFDDMTTRQALELAPELGGAAGPPSRSLQTWVERQRGIYARASVCFVGSEWCRESLLSDFGVAPERVRVAGFGRNLDPAPPEQRSWDPPKFLFVGRDWEKKNGAAVLSAFRELREGGLSEATLTLAGGHPPVREEGVVALGPLSPGDKREREQLCRLFRESTCLVMPSWFEPFGIVHLEAGAAGTPSIGTTVGGAATAIGAGGITVDPGDRGALLAAMRQLADPALAREAGERGRRHSELFTWELVAARIAGAAAPIASDGPDEQG